MDAQRLRQLTSGVLHTDMRHVLQDLAWFTNLGEPMTHQLPNVLDAVKPYLLQQLEELGEKRDFVTPDYRPDIVGEVNIRPLKTGEAAAVLMRFGEMESPLQKHFTK